MKYAKAQPTDENDSELPSGSQKGDSVYDFLYHDARRVGSYLAQFETYGHPSQVKATESVGRAQVTRVAGGTDVGIPAVAKAQVALDSSDSDDERDITERTYDPLWTNARTLLDYLAEHNLIRSDPWNCRLGQFILAKGMLIVLDLAMLKNMWEKPTVKSFVLKGAGVQHSSTSGKAKPKAMSELEQHAKLLIEMLTVLPHSIQAHFLNENYSMWCSLAEHSLVGMSSDLVLKHGALVQGEWHVLGILDAQPDPRIGEGEEGVALTPLEAAVVSSAGTIVGSLAAQIAPPTRQMLGRPRHSFGITPLLIFREVSGPDRDLAETAGAGKE